MMCKLLTGCENITDYKRHRPHRPVPFLRYAGNLGMRLRLMKDIGISAYVGCFQSEHIPEKT